MANKKTVKPDNEVHVGNAIKGTRTRSAKITEFTPDSENPNLHTERGLDLVATSLEIAGLGRSIVVDKKGKILAGNGLVEVAVEKGFEDAIVVPTNGDTLVIVQRDDLDLEDDPEHRARMYTYLDNRSAQLSITFSAAQLLAHQKAGVDMKAAGFTADEIRALIGRAALGQGVR